MVVDNEANRTHFTTGAVRARGNGKGRFDLLPIEIMSLYLESVFDIDTDKPTIYYIGQFQKSGNINAILAAMEKYRLERGWSKEDTCLEVAIQFEEGELKYPSDVVNGKVCLNALKGLPLSTFIDSATRHYLKWRKEMNDERHDRAVIWNLLMAAWTVAYRHDCNDLCYDAFVGKWVQPTAPKEDRKDGS